MKRELAHVSLRLWFASLAVFIAFSIWLWLWRFPDDPSAQYHLLAALAESMAAILGLVFTISLVVAELTASYSHRLLPRVLTPVTIGYIVLFIFSMMVPLVLMVQASAHAIRVSLMLGGLSLVLLIPYFRYFIYRIGPTALLDDLANTAMDNLRSGRDAAEVETIDNVCMHALGMKDYDIFKLALTKLGELVLAPVNEETTLPSLASIWSSLRDISLAAINDSRALRLSINAIQEFGLKATAGRLKYRVPEIISVLEKVGVTAAARAMEDGTRETVFALGGLGRSAAENHLDWPARYSISILTQLTRSSLDNRMTAVVPFTVDAIEGIGGVAAASGLRDAALQSASSLADIGVLSTVKGYKDVASQAAIALKQLRSTSLGAGVVEEALRALRSTGESPGFFEELGL